MQMRVESIGDATAVGIETPDGGMTVIVQRGDLHAEMYLSAHQRQAMRYAAGAEKARQTRARRVASSRPVRGTDGASETDSETADRGEG